MANFIANNLLALLLSAQIDLDTDTTKLLFADATCSADDEDDNVGDIGTLGELSGTGYVGGHGGSGRHSLTNASVTVDDPNDEAELDFDDPAVWSSIDAGTIDHIIWHKPGTSDDSDAKVIGLFDAIDQATNGGDITVSLNAEGILKLSRAAGS